MENYDVAKLMALFTVKDDLIAKRNEFTISKQDVHDIVDKFSRNYNELKDYIQKNYSDDFARNV